VIRIVRKRYRYLDDVPLGTNPPICRGDVVHVVSCKKRRVTAKHKKKKVKFNLSNIEMGYFDEA